MYKKLIVLLFVVSSCEVSEVETLDSNYGTFKLQYLYQENLNYIVKTQSNENSGWPYYTCNASSPRVEMNDDTPNFDSLYLDFQYNEGHIKFYTQQRNKRTTPIFINHIEIMNNFRDKPIEGVTEQTAFNKIQVGGLVSLFNEVDGVLTDSPFFDFRIIYKTTNVENLIDNIGCDSISTNNFNMIFEKDDEPIIEIEHSVSQSNYEFYDIGFTYEVEGEKYRVIDKWIK